MRGITHRWVDRATRAPAPSDQPRTGHNPLVERILRARGLCDPNEIARFCNPVLRDLHDPSLLPDADAAAQRMLDAARAGRQIVIYGDYDVDGITASAILFHTLRAIAPGCDVRTYIPHRLEEGYGLNPEAIASLADAGADLIVSVDCGVTAVGPAQVARDRAVDLIITDHHSLPASGLPGALAIVHPRLPGSAYPFGDLCGAGVAFKLAWRLATLAEGSPRVRDHIRDVLLDALALAAIGTVADIVPLVGENRLIAFHGLRRVPSTRIEGLNALIEASRLSGEKMDAEKVGFTLGPRLNACGRMGHAGEALELLTTATGDRAATLAAGLSRVNEDRRRTERAISEEAEALAVARGMTDPACRAIVLAHPDWHAGVVGICCSRLVGRFQRPTILLRSEGGVCHGSGRSIDGFNLHHALESCAGFLERFGGHDMAAGLSLSESHLEEFTHEFTAIANDAIAVEDLVPTLDFDCEASLDELTPAVVEQLERLGPFGRSNPSPRLLVRGARLVRRPEPFGTRGNHLAFFVEQSGRSLRLIGWNWGSRTEPFHSGDLIDAVIEPKLNRWNGRSSVEPVIADLATGCATESAVTSP